MQQILGSETMAATPMNPSVCTPPTTTQETVTALGHVEPLHSIASDLEYITFSKCVVKECCTKIWKYMQNEAFQYVATCEASVEHIRNIYAFLFGYGQPFIMQHTASPHPKLFQSHNSVLRSGAPLKKICVFRQRYLDKVLSADWLEVAYDAICALTEMPEAKLFLNDPEAIIEGYRYIIREPMWLKKVEAKTRNRMYKMAMEFKSDVTKIFRNAKEFMQNCSNSEILPFDLQTMKKDCQSMEDQFGSIWKVISKTFQESEKRKHQLLKRQEATT